MLFSKCFPSPKCLNVCTAKSQSKATKVASPVTSAPPSSNPVTPRRHHSLVLLRQDSEDESEDGSFALRRMTSRASRNSEFFSLFASALQDAQFREIIIARAQEHYCSEAFKFLAAILELEDIPDGEKKRRFAVNIVNEYVKEGAPHENHLSSQTRADLLDWVQAPEFSDNGLDLMFLPAKAEVIEDVKFNPVLRQIALSCLGTTDEPEMERIMEEELQTI